ncbi:unnamed protein product, partial [Heterobilharzia americana]
MHFLILIENLNCWLGEGNLKENSTRVSVESLIDQVPGIRDEISSRIANIEAIPKITLENLIPYELPVLSEL